MKIENCLYIRIWLQIYLSIPHLSHTHVYTRTHPHTHSYTLIERERERERRCINTNCNFSCFLIRKLMIFVKLSSHSRLKFRKFFLLKQVFSKIIFSRPAAVITHSSINGTFLPNILFDGVWNVRLFFMSLYSLQIPCALHFSCFCYWKFACDIVSVICYGSWFAIM